jgi:hypothetical protein
LEPSTIKPELGIRVALIARVQIPEAMLVMRKENGTVFGSLVGGSASLATAWITQNTLNRRELMGAEIRKREMLYGEFIHECSKLITDSLTHTLVAAP